MLTFPSAQVTNEIFKPARGILETSCSEDRKICLQATGVYADVAHSMSVQQGRTKAAQTREPKEIGAEPLGPLMVNSLLPQSGAVTNCPLQTNLTRWAGQSLKTQFAARALT